MLYQVLLALIERGTSLGWVRYVRMYLHWVYVHCLIIARSTDPFVPPNLKRHAHAQLVWNVLRCLFSVLNSHFSILEFQFSNFAARPDNEIICTHCPWSANRQVLTQTVALECIAAARECQIN